MDTMEREKFTSNIGLLLQKIALLEKEKLLSVKKAGYNVISLIRDETDEVNLHSKIIHDLLNPDGTHQLGQVLLKHFLEEVEVEDFDCRNVKVYREYKNIDILIISSGQAIIIENKIRAGDQDRQLERYWKSIESSGITDIWVLYLTVDNHTPSEQSIGSLTDEEQKRIFNIGYGQQIRKWLDKCYLTAIDHPELRESLKQYMHIVNHISGRIRTMELSKEIAQLLDTNDNLKYAIAIAESIPIAKAAFAKRVWEQIVAVAHDKDLHNSKYKSRRWDNEGLLEGYYRGVNGNHWYGTTFGVGKVSDDLYVEYRLEVSHILYHGFLAVRKNGELVEKGDPDRVKLEQYTQEINKSFHPNKWWLGYLKHEDFNFTTLQINGEEELGSPESLQMYISHLFDLLMPNIEKMRTFVANG
jgi:hypothetical protein